MNKKIYILIVSAFLISQNMQAQTILSKSEIIQIILESSFDVKVAENAIEVAKNNTSIYNSGYLPTLNASAGLNFNKDNIAVEFQDGSERSLDGATSNSENAGLSLNYVLFDGFNRKYNISRNQETLNRSQLNARSVLENTLLQAFTAYYEVARLEQNLQSLIETLSISKERLVRAEYGFDYGRNTKLDVSNAEVDVNTDSINYLNARQSFSNAKRNLNFILGRNVAPIDYSVDTTLTITEINERDDFASLMLTQNVQYLIAQSDVNLRQFDTRIASTNYLPTLSLTSGYNFRKGNNNSASFTASNSSSGLTGGLTFGWNLFDGGQTKTATQNAKINESTQETLLLQIENQIHLNFENAWGDFQNRKFIVKAQENNLKTNQLNFERTEEQYRLGQVSSIEFRTSQTNLLVAQTSLVQAKYEAKLAELTLFQLAGKLQEANF
ncbi:MAG: outer membrane protein [Roseivirga sp.]|jgi:outer membrane protein